MITKGLSMTAKDGLDVGSAFVVLATLGEFLPAIASLLAIIWTGIRIYEWFRHRVMGIKDDPAP